MSHRCCPVSPEGAAFITTSALGKSNLFRFHLCSFKMTRFFTFLLLRNIFLCFSIWCQMWKKWFFENACRSNPLNMSAMGTVPILPLPLALTVAFLNNLNVLLNGGGAVAGFKWDLHEKENCSPLTLIVLNMLRGEDYSGAAVFSKTMLHALDVRKRIIDVQQFMGLSNFQCIWYFSCIE